MEKLKVNKDACISCGACVGMFPEIFVFGDDDRAEVKDNMKDDMKDDIIDAIEGCPTGAIGYEEVKEAA